ncbi:MAG: hypothetical protein V3U76_16100 [Granulosicoccus sp.]
MIFRTVRHSRVVRHIGLALLLTVGGSVAFAATTPYSNLEELTRIEYDGDESGVTFAKQYAVDDDQMMVGSSQLSRTSGRNIRKTFFTYYLRSFNGPFPVWLKTQILTDNMDTGGNAGPVALQDDRALIYGADDLVYVYENQGLGQWEEVARLRPDADEEFDRFFSVSKLILDGDRAVIGATGEPNDVGRGVVYVFERGNDGIWAQQARLISAETSHFGHSIDLEGDTMIVGAAATPVAGYGVSGIANIYNRNSSGEWVESAVLEPSLRSEHMGFGSEVAIDNDVILVGAPGSGPNTAGGVYAFERDNTGQWIERDFFVADVPPEETRPVFRFGSSLDLQSDLAAVQSTLGSQQGDAAAQGIVTLFRRNSDGTWQEFARRGDSYTGRIILEDQGVFVRGANSSGEAVLVQIEASPGRDTDEDGIANHIDNCPNDYNPNQLDGDGDGQGDVCDEESEPTGTAPSCNGVTATIFVDEQDRIIGGPDGGQWFTGELNGTDGDDVMVATVRSDVVRGNSGNDLICALGDDDEIYGDDGDDVIYAGSGNDFIQGNDGADEIFGQAGRDLMFGGKGNDTLDGGVGNDLIFGQGGSNIAAGGEGEDHCYSVSANSTGCGRDSDNGKAPSCNGVTATIYVNEKDRVIGGPQDGEWFTGELNGTDGDDVMVATPRSDLIRGRGGNDLICALADADEIYGGDGNDVVYAGSGDDYIRGEGGADELYGEAGHEMMFGGNGNDTLDGGLDNDQIFGGGGTDTGIGGAGNNNCYAVATRSNC